MNAFLTALQSRNVLLMDGAMGTELQRLTQAASFEGYARFNLTHPELVHGVHRAYLDAGAQVLLTNTFQANPSDAQHHEIWSAALCLARDVAGEARFVLADIGPVEKLTDAIARDLLQESRHADGILLETWSSLDALKRFAKIHKEITDTPLLVSFTYQRDNAVRELQTFEKVRPEECARAALDAGASGLGANCGKDIGMHDMLELVERYRSVCTLPLFVRPNAGTPTHVGSEWDYPHSAKTMAEALPALLQAGVSMVGGCCGTTPDYIRAFRDVIDTKTDFVPLASLPARPH